MKYLVRHTIDEKWENLKDMKFDEFLFEVGMFESSVKYDIIRDEDRKKAKLRYIRAISSGIQGSATC